MRREGRAGGAGERERKGRERVLCLGATKGRGGMVEGEEGGYGERMSRDRGEGFGITSNPAYFPAPRAPAGSHPPGSGCPPSSGAVSASLHPRQAHGEILGRIPLPDRGGNSAGGAASASVAAQSSGRTLIIPPCVKGKVEEQVQGHY